MSDDVKFILLITTIIVLFVIVLGLINFFTWWVPKYRRRHRVMKLDGKYIIYQNFYGSLRYKCDEEWYGWSDYKTNSYVVKYNTEQEARAECADYPFNWKNRRAQKREAQRKAELLNTYKREVEKPLDISKY